MNDSALLAERSSSCNSKRSMMIERYFNLSSSLLSFPHPSIHLNRWINKILEHDEKLRDIQRYLPSRYLKTRWKIEERYHDRINLIFEGTRHQNTQTPSEGICSYRLPPRFELVSLLILIFKSNCQNMMNVQSQKYFIHIKRGKYDLNFSSVEAVVAARNLIIR